MRQQPLERDAAALELAEHRLEPDGVLVEDSDAGGEVWHFELLLLTRANSLAALSAMARLSWSRATSNRFSLTSPSRQFGWDQFSGSVRSARLRDGGVPGRRTSGRGRAELQRVLGSWSAGGAELLGRSLSTLPALTDAT